MPDGQMRPVDRSGLAGKIVLAQSEGPYLLGGMKIERPNQVWARPGA